MAFVVSAAAAMMAMVTAAFLVVGVVRAADDLKKDLVDCQPKLASMMTCLDYASAGSRAPAPTRDCCTALTAVAMSDPKCLCVLVADKDDPALDAMGIKVNVTRALGMPAACNALPASAVASCPGLLGLPADSKQAQVFEQYAKQHAGGGGRKAALSSTASAPQKSGAAAARVMRWWGAAKDGGAGAAVLSAAAPLVAPFLLLLALLG